MKIKRNILPESQRYMAWTIAVAVFFLIVLTGYIAVQAAAIDAETAEAATSVVAPRTTRPGG